VFPLFEWSWRVILFLILDKNLPEGSFSFQDTLKQPQWENFTNNIFGDTYLFFGFITIGFKLIFLKQDFIDQYPQLIPALLIELAIPFVTFSLVLIVLSKLIYRIRTNRINIELSQFYLTTIKVNSENPPSVESYYLNQAWPLFQRGFIPYYSTALEEIKSSQYSIKNHSSQIITLRGPDDVYNRFQDFGKSLDDLWEKIDNKNLYYHKKYSKYPIHSLMRELQIKIGFWLMLYSKLLGRINQKSIYDFFKDSSGWETFPDEIKKLIESSIQEVIRNKPALWDVYEEKIDVDWILSLYQDLNSLMINLEKFLSEFETYIRKSFKTNF
jgi:hypothetical protein